MKDTIYRDAAIEAVAEDLASVLNVCKDETRELAEHALSALPSAEAVSREDYNETDGVITIEKQNANEVGEIEHIVIRSPNYTRYFYNESMPLPSADAVKVAYICDGRACNGDCISEECAHTKDIEHAKNFIRLGDRYMELSEAVQGWIPCSERLPKDLEAVNVTWINHNPPVYYQHIKDVPKADTAVYYRGAWYWWDAGIIDLLGEFDGAYIINPIDKDIEVLAWMPLPEPYKGGEDE